jgi:hypothetical protein
LQLITADSKLNEMYQSSPAGHPRQCHLQTIIKSCGKKRICKRKSLEREEIEWGEVYWQAASLAKAGEQENQVSEEAILATRLEGWIRA